jgi:hypothetical protein
MTKLENMDALSKTDKHKYPGTNIWGAKLLHHLNNTSRPNKDSSMTDPLEDEAGFVRSPSLDTLTVK